ncbi:putative ribonuclease H-like domain-containing protein [Tanacetum coccineum]
MTHPYPKRSFVPQAVLTRSGKLSTASIAVNTVRSVNTIVSKPIVNHPKSKTNTFKIGYSQSSSPFKRHFANKNNIINTNVNTARLKYTTAGDRAVVRENKGKGANAKEYKEKGVIDNGCSRHMTGNKCYLDEYEDYDGGFVSFGDGKRRISGKGKIKTGSFDFHDVYFCKELKYNMFSVSQICDKKNNVLFTNIECLVLSSNFKLLDESQVLLRALRKDNIYSVDLKSVVPTEDLTCLIAKATIDESNMWHRWLGYINFKTMNKLVKGNLVKGLPSKIFENDHSCVAYQKGKQHKASYKTKLVNSISKPLHMLHMDLFGPTNVKSLMKKSYCLVVTDDFSRFSWKTSTGRFHETFWVLVTILNTKDHLGKFDGKADEGFFVGFLENKPNVKGNRPDWLFDVDSLSISMNYVPVAAGNKTNGIVGTKDNIVADENKVLDKSGKHDQEARSVSERLNQREMQTEHTNSTNGINTVSTPVSTDGPSFDTAVPSTPINATGPFVSTANESEEQLFERFSPFKNVFTLPPVPNISSMDNTGIFGNAYDDEDVEEEADMNNAIGTKWAFRNKKDEKSIVVKKKATLVAQGHTQEEGIDYDEVFAPVARIESIRLFMAYASFKDFIVYQMDVKSAFLYGKIEEGVYVCQPPSFEDPHFLDKVYKVEKALYGLHQAPRAWHKDDILLVQVYVDNIIFGSTKKQMSNEFETLMHNKFQMSSMGEISFFLGLQVKQKSDGIFISQDKYVAEILKMFDFASVKTASTPMETNKALVKDEEAKDVDVHLYRSMIGSLMYLTASRPDIMFAIYACERFQVTPKTSHFNAVKMIFRYLKGQPKLGLWYLRDSPFDLEAFLDSDYAGASLDRKSTIGGVMDPKSDA